MKNHPMNRDYARLRWQCRRGMLELDLILQGYLDDQFERMSEQDKDQFAQLLKQSDQTLLAWCLGYQTPPHEQDGGMVELIRQSVVSA